jgi:HD-GYP domain-containing protein (c-di-GMP phosphodiesterase class II)
MWLRRLFDDENRCRYDGRTSRGLGMNLVVYVSPRINSDSIVKVLEKHNLQVKEISAAIQEDPSPKILIAEKSDLKKLPDNVQGILLVAENEDSISSLQLPENITMDFCEDAVSAHKVQNVIKAVLLMQQIQEIRSERDTSLRRLKELNNIGVALSTERDLFKLGDLILRKSREITAADAGSLYLVEGEEESTKRLRFKITQNDSMQTHFEESVIPLTKESIAGYVASTGETLNIPDVYDIPSDQEYKFNRNFDEQTGYRTTSTLVVPMKNHKGEIVGVIQLINRKIDFQTKLNRVNYRNVTRSFDDDDEDLVSSLASQAAVALENSRLIKNIETLFEGFVTASVTAIESRDPTTSGHSFRVADLTVELAKVVDQSDGNFKDINFTSDEIKEMRYAGLLHDFGKVGVRENVLVKAKKLYPMQLELIRERFNHYQRAWEAEYYKSKLDVLLQHGKDAYEAQHKLLEQVFKNRLNSLQDYLSFIIESNEPNILPDGNFEKLLMIAADSQLIPPGLEDPMLKPDEVQLLSIRKGSLNDRERVEIESHVTHTFHFLSKIPWTSELKRVPKIAYGHHEKLNGSGYPNHSSADEIPIQTRMMTISDIYDALTASDRPYKRAVPSERALDILSSEVKSGQVDSNLFQIFLDAKIYLLSFGK